MKKLLATQYISYGLVSPHLENPADFPKPVFTRKGLCRDTPQLIYINVSRNVRKMNISNLKTAYWDNSTLIIELSPFIYLDNRNPRLPRKQSRGYNLIADTDLYFMTILKCINTFSHTNKYKVQIEVICGKDRLGKADLDNYSKAILDGITKSKKIWGDDKQIDDLHITRIYSENDKSYMIIKIETLK